MNTEQINIDIIKDNCILCGKCVRVCPTRLFSIKGAGKEAFVETDMDKGCIACGHCVDVCESGAVSHSLFDMTKRHKSDRSALPSPDSLMHLLTTRRSNRAFKKEPVPDNIIDDIVKAANLAPTATNSQELEYVVITDPDKLKAVSSLVIESLNKVSKMMSNPLLTPMFKLLFKVDLKYKDLFREMKSDFDNGYDHILRGATALILICAPSYARFGCQDANLAYQNGSLYAEAAGVSQFYTGFVCSVINKSEAKELRRMLGINGTVHAGMALGMPSFYYPYYTERKPAKVTRH